MRAVQYRSNSDISVIEVPEPTPGPGEIIVRMELCGVCGSDVMEWYLTPRAPLTPGHEPVGEIVEVGPGVERLKVGQRVFVHHHVPCMVCPRCRRGNWSTCPRFKQTRLDPGGLAEYVRVPAPNVELDVLPLPDDMTSEAAVLIEPVACAIRAVARANVRPGDRVAIVGAGVNGIFLTQLSRLAGASRIIVSDPIAVRRNRMPSYGADAVIDPSIGPAAEQLAAANDGRLADIVFVGPSGLGPAQAGLELLEPGGYLMLFAPCAPGVQLPIEPHRLWFQEHTIGASYSAGPHETRIAFEYLRSGLVRGPEVITHRFPMERALDAFQMTAHPGDGLKAVIEMR
ncbi:MAG: sorbitol dehydrogenase [Dehalococcoidia bacterium]|nr:MAG: sorbitol dehydrogenase [Dehalococcoidia bacterium]